MKKIRLISNLIALFSLTILSSCAAGSATAAYAVKASSADSLSASGEQQIVDRVKREIIAELGLQSPYCQTMPSSQYVNSQAYQQ